MSKSGKDVVGHKTRYRNGHFEHSPLTRDEADALLVAADKAKAARLDEAKWWRHLGIMHQESYFAVEGNKRIAELESTPPPAAKEKP